jgi:hypothetical protein
MMTLVYNIASRGGSARMDANLRKLWTGPVGRKLFAIAASRSTKARPTAKLVSAELGPLTLFEGLPKDVRKELTDVTRVVNSLVAAQSALVARELQLANSQTEASRGTAGVATDTLDRVVTELAEAKTAAVHRREEIAAALERMRLEIIRLRSGIGTVADVRREAERAKGLLSA